MEPFIPDHLPIPKLNWEQNAASIGRANRAISRYDGLLQGIPNPNIMLSPLTSQEAVLSSRIEGTRATLGDVLQYDAGHTPTEKERASDVIEIKNYRSALWHAKYSLAHRNFSLNLLKELHQKLLSEGRGKNKNPGRFRTTQNWIGSPGSSIEEAYFIPPPPYILQDYLENFEQYYNSDRPDPVVQLAIIHAQFEIIHPFEDGNGRLGRMLIPLFLYEKKILSEPMFYLSGYLEANRDIYIQHLRSIGNISTAWDAWICFFMQAVIEQAEININIVRKIMTLYNDLKNEILKLTHSQYAIPILDCMFSAPIFRPAELAQRERMPSRAQLGNFFKFLKDAGIVTVFTKGRGRTSEVLILPSLINLCEGRQVFSDPRNPSNS
jgi:Fic family protein